MDRDPDTAIQRTKHLHQPVQRETPEIGVADPREIRGGKAGRARGLANRQSAFIEHGDDPGGEDRLGLFQIRLRVAKIAKLVSVS